MQSVCIHMQCLTSEVLGCVVEHLLADVTKCEDECVLGCQPRGLQTEESMQVSCL